MHSKRKCRRFNLLAGYKPRNMADDVLKVNNVRQFKSELKSKIHAEWIVEQVKKSETFVL